MQCTMSAMHYGEKNAMNYADYLEKCSGGSNFSYFGKRFPKYEKNLEYRKGEDGVFVENNK